MYYVEYFIRVILTAVFGIVVFLQMDSFKISLILLILFAGLMTFVEFIYKTYEGRF